MPESEQSQRKARRAEEREVEDVAPADSSHKAELDSEVDSPLDEIDDVLEVNAEEFVRRSSRRAASERPLVIGRLDPDFLRADTSSFADFAARVAPNVLPSQRNVSAGAGDLVPHGTTIVAATFLVASRGRGSAGDHGHVTAQRDIEKVYPADEFSIIGIAGAAGIAVEMVGLFQVELEHYEKIEGAPLSLVGKANRLATMIRMNLPLAMQGLLVVPLFAGWDAPAGQGRIFSYDGTGGKYEEHAFFSVGSGAVFARGSLKKLYRPDLEAGEATMAVIQASTMPPTTIPPQVVPI